ncbi:3-keto-5-aminohexanoate cleavage protein [Bordetella petrii]|uniref:3-keto-5-aminohexanoate cleavage protein n=1 Tax=Bordetella petrii TaxID=94624 RepID=UPI001A978027|nr:3-keto-5-aminohexanoate cleavage protein [Bordetella petrii]MBO1114588.1 3-keto-5-aminohexanoate cleavage protein [Bordetella petrii]
MSDPVILTCAVTGGDDVAAKYPQLPVTPRQIAQASVEAARAGAAIVHIHVRDPQTGKPSMAVEHYREVVQRIRDSGSDVIVNLTTGPGARYVPALDQTNGAAPGSNVRPPQERVRHVAELRPEICTLDMGSVNFGAGALVNTASQIQAIAAAIPAGVKIELEIFDTGHLALANKMIADGIIAADSIFQFALGIPWGAPATTETMLLLRNAIGRDAVWAAFGIGRHEFPMVAQALLLDGQIRVGLEDNFYLDKGVQAQSNAQLVEKAAGIAAALGRDLATPAQARQRLGLAAR